MSTVLETNKLSKRYRRTWALQDCTLSLPARRVAALVGPNGAGKTTLLHLAAGLLEPTKGSVQVFGLSPSLQPGEALPRLGFVAQDTPLYKGFKVEELLTLGRKLNPHWDDGLAHAEAGHSTEPARWQALRRTAGAGGARAGAGEAA